jgi:hypothetical protein
MSRPPRIERLRPKPALPSGEHDVPGLGEKAQECGILACLAAVEGAGHSSLYVPAQRYLKSAGRVAAGGSRLVAHLSCSFLRFFLASLDWGRERTLPESRRRRRRSTNLALNKIRGAGRTERALQLARAASSEGYTAAADWALRNLKVAGPLHSLRPHRLEHLLQLSTLDALPLEQELIWTRTIIRSHASTIDNAVRIKRRIEEALLTGEEGDAFAHLDALEAESGVSLTSISLRIGLLQLYRGLEAQKDEYSKIKSSAAHQNVRFFSYWWSVRAEDSSSWLNFERDFAKRLKAWDIPEPLRAHISFHMLRRVPTIGQEQLLLSSSIQGNALDLYEALLELVVTSIIENRPASQALISAIREAAAEIGDARLTKLDILSGDLGAISTLPVGRTTYRDAEVSGSATPTEPVASIDELYAAARQLGGSSSKGNLRERIAFAVAELDSPGGRDRAQAELLKAGAILDHLSIGRWLTHASKAPRRTDITAQEVMRAKFANSHSVEPEVALWVSGNAGDICVRELMRTNRESSYLRWCLYLSGRQAQADELRGTLSEVTTAELAVLTSLADPDCSSDMMNATAHLAEIAGGPTELGLRAEIMAALRQRGLEAAIILAANYMLTSPDLAHWLPLKELAAEVRASEFTCHNCIEFPIFLDFVTKVADSSFSSDRTYASEDYLIAKGAHRPSDLVDRIPPESATPEEIHFFSELCTPSVLRTSTLFQNERELEQDRIVVCRWLIASDYRNSERFEEEARELVRSHHIKMGIQALAGSKLSIDQDGLRRWAEVTIAEDYSRYLDLLEQGIFAPNDEFRRAVYSVLEGSAGTPQSLEIPDNEAAALFAKIVGAVMREFALHPEHGLDAYLSLRIRHGTLSGHLRGPVERERLITRRDSEGRYQENEFWAERLGEVLRYDELELIEDRLQALSSTFDSAVARLTDQYLQVRRPEKPEGMLLTAPTPVIINSMIAETNPGQSFDDFFGRCVDVFWALVATSEREVFSRLTSVADEISNLFSKAETDVWAIGADHAGPLRDALLRARTTTLSSIESIKEWLTPPTTPAHLILSVEDLIRVSLAVMKGFYRDFSPNVDFRLFNLPDLPGVIRLFSDIFFIVFENVIKYSGNAVDPDIVIEATKEREQLRFKVTNSVEIVTAEARSRIALAKERIETGSFRRAVRGEGGTGLPKLAKVIGYGSGGGSLSFALAEDEKSFTLEFSLKLIDLSELHVGEGR